MSCENLGGSFKCKEREEWYEHGEEAAETPGERGTLQYNTVQTWL